LRSPAAPRAGGLGTRAAGGPGPRRDAARPLRMPVARSGGFGGRPRGRSPPPRGRRRLKLPGLALAHRTPLAVAMGTWGGWGAACTASEEPVVVENVPVDSVVFWPPTLRYARFGDTLSLHVRGLKRQRTCAHIEKL